jgi:hypothetical protein
MKFHRMIASALPAWVPQRYLAQHVSMYNGDRVEPLVCFLELSRGGRHLYELSGVYRLLGRHESRDGWIYVAVRWYWFAQLELFLQSCLWYAVVALIRCGLFRAPYEGAFFHEHRFDPPDLWGSPITRHERGYARRYHW